MTISTRLKRLSIIGFFLLSTCFFSAIAPSTSAQTAEKQVPTSEQILKNLGSAGKTPFGLDEQEASSGVSKTSIGGVIGNIVKAVLGFTGTIAFIIFLYGGFLWLTARGNDSQVEQAKKYLTNGVVGTIVIILAYSVTYYITDVLFRATQ